MNRGKYKSDPNAYKDELKTTKVPKKYTLIRLGRYLYEYKLLVIISIILTILSNLFSLVGPLLSGYAIDAIQFGTGKVLFDKVFFYVSLMIIFYILSSVLSYILSILMITLTQKVVTKMRKDVFNKISELPISYFDKHQTGDIISRISYDIDTINESLSSDFVQISTSIITVIGSFIMMVTISKSLVTVFIITIPMSIIFTKYMTKKVQPLYKKRSETSGILNGFVEEIVSGINTIKAYNQQEKFIKDFDNINTDAVNAYYNSDYYGSMLGPSINFINNLSLSLISVLGALLYLFKSITLGNVSSFILYSRKFSGPINEVANIMTDIQSTIAAAERVFNLLDEKTENESPENEKVIEDVQGNVTMNNVYFGYNKNKAIIKNLSLKVKKGSIVAIVGPTGSGKTTLINLLMRFYDTDSGEIYIDDSNIKEVTKESLRRSFSMVLQDTWLFNGTIFENIAYGKENATMEEVIEAAKAAKIHSYIMHLPKKYDTVLNEEGMNISKGQKQLLTIARAMLLDSKMLILDEATSNVDTRTEVKIQEAMKNLMKDKTCFVIAHRLSTIRNADLILVVKDGEIIEQGNHNELMKANGFYAALYYSQFD